MTESSKINHLTYKLSFPNGKEYIGVTGNVKRRLKEHECADTLVGHAIRKYGSPVLQVLAICTRDYAYDLERKAVEKFDTVSPTGYNLVNGGLGGLTGRKVSVETRRKLSEARTGLKIGPPSDETKRKLAARQRGKQHSFETREKMSEIKIGVQIGPKSDTHKKKISEGLKKAYIRREALALP